MKYSKKINNRSKGFTLVEVIVTILATGILGAIFINFVGTALTSSWNAVEITRDETGAEALMEQIIGEYIEDINSSPSTALSNIFNAYNGQTFNGVAITTQYITFDGSGNEVASGPSPNLKVVLQHSGPVSPAITGRYSLTTVLTESRDTSDPIVIY